MNPNRIVYAVHKWMGIVGGAVLVVVGLTGSVIVFDDELDRWLNPRLLEVAPGGPSLPVDAQVVAAAQAMPEGKLDGIYLPVPQCRAPDPLTSSACSPRETSSSSWSA